MKLRLTAMVLILACVLSGCSLWMDGSYVSIEPHPNPGSIQNSDVAAASDYLQIRNVIEETVEAGKQSCLITVEAIDRGQIDSYMNTAIRYVLQNNPMASYAVNEIIYELGTANGVAAVSLTVIYSRNLNEIRRIRQVKGVSAAKTLIHTALEQCDADITMMIQDYADTDFVQLVQDYALAHPEVVMEIPQVSVGIYPDSGNDRVVSLQFTYQTSRDSLRSMYSYVQPVFSSASMYVSGEGEQRLKYAQLYSFLMERNSYTVETSITPAYSLLRHGVGDSRAFATVYAAMCREAGLEAYTVIGTRSGGPWCWNIICEDGRYYHVDLLQSHRGGGYRKLTDREMSGYVWDYTAYPACG